VTNRHTARISKAVAGLLAFVVIAAACGSSSKSGSTTSAGPATTAGLKGGGNEGKPVEGGSLVYGIEADTSGGWCLYKAQLAIGGIQVARAIYDTLTMPGGDGKIHPFLAQSVTPNSTYNLWTITLRPGIKFTDGSPLTAQVVVDNLNHYRKDNPLFTFVFTDVTAINTTGPLTLTVSTKVPWVAFPWFLWSSSRLGIMAEAQMKSPNCNTDLIGTGPFIKKSWTFGDKFVAVKNPNYWRKDAAGNQLPYLDQITFVPQEDGPKRLAALESGDFQAMHTSGPKQIVPLRADVKAGKLKDLESDKFTEVGYTMLNATTAPFNHYSARAAFAYAIDRDTFNKLRNDGILTNASGPFAPGVDGYMTDTGLPSFDPAKAKQYAAQYKQETGKDLTFTLSHTADPDTTADAELIQEMLKQNAGVSIGLNPVPDQSTLINNAIGKKYDAVLWRNHPGADDDTQYVWWHCDNGVASLVDPQPAGATCNNPVNFGGFNDPVINKDFDAARSTPDPAKRVALYQDINKEFAKQLWNLWGQWVIWTVGYANSVHGILGPNLPDGAAPFEGLPTGHPVDGIWCTNGKC
jgi:peptide/nickel transport system substrate-binding protein